MTLTISLPHDAEQVLKERARAAGQDVKAFVEAIVARELAAPISILEAAEPIVRAVDAAGVSDEEFTATIEEALRASRRERRQRL